MIHESPEVKAARQVTTHASEVLGRSPSFQQLPPQTRDAIVRDLNTIQQAFIPSAPAPDPYALTLEAPSAQSSDPYALAMETPNDLARRRGLTRQRNGNEPAPEPSSNPPSPRTAATETLAARAGALSDEINFPAFVASLVQGTFDAIVDASIRQMEAFASLVSAVAKDVDRFTSENVTSNQVRDWLVEQYPRDLVLDFASGQPKLHHRPPADGEASEPSWLADYGLDGVELTDEVIEQQLIPAARRRYGESRMQMLATMVLMGMNRINVRDGSVSAKLRFRAAARDRAAVDYAVSQDPGDGGWGGRGRVQSSMMVSTVGANVQSESELKAELFGEVKINFVSETLPLERFVDAAQMALLQQNSRTGKALPSTATPPAIAPPATPPPPAPPA
ncbi:hypothetical protein H6F89_14225 [Cyanobacteria bacterium FACHB-63]|nr:hypothetical protein [Cyanobacteria bacterium FACHB-63]